MKFTIEGFSQEYALTLQKEVEVNGKKKRIKVDCNDLVILRWFVDFYPKMMKVEIDGKQYAWIKYQALLEDLPLLDIKKRMLFDRLQKLVDFGILAHKSIKSGGSFSYYGFGENYMKLVDTSARTPMQKIADGKEENAEGYAENCETVSKKMQTVTQKNAEQINSSIKDTSINNQNTNNKGKDIDALTTKKFKVGSYENVLISNEEITKLVEAFGEQDAKEAIEHLSEYIELKNYKVKSHYLAIRKWVIDAVREQRIKKQELEQREQRAKEIESKQKADETKFMFNGKRISELSQVEYEEYLMDQKQKQAKTQPIYNWLEPEKNKALNYPQHKYTKEQLDGLCDDIDTIEV